MSPPADETLDVRFLDAAAAFGWFSRVSQARDASMGQAGIPCTVTPHYSAVQAGQAAPCTQAQEQIQQSRSRLYGTAVKGTHGKLQMQCSSLGTFQESRGWLAPPYWLKGIQDEGLVGAGLAGRACSPALEDSLSFGPCHLPVAADWQ